MMMEESGRVKRMREKEIKREKDRGREREREREKLMRRMPANGVTFS